MYMDNILMDKQIWVVIPVYNGRKYLEDAVYSVLSQPVDAIDVVVVDDGSTDGSSEFCDLLARKYERLHIIHKENGGVSSARNVGIDYVLRHLDGEQGYVAFLDADDCWTRGFLSERVIQLLTYGYQLIGFQSCDCDKHMKKVQNPGVMEAGFHQGGADHVWIHAKEHFGAMFYSAQLLNDYCIRFQDGLRYSEDKIFSMQCLYLAESVWLENQVLYLYRHSSGSAMGSRQFGIQHFLPIIEGYWQLDCDMQKYANQSSGQLLASKHCISHYLMDMIDEHFQQWHGKAEIESLLNEHPRYRAALLGEDIFDRIQPNPRYLSYTNNPGKYMFKQYVLGIVIFMKLLIKRYLS